ncbi:MAG: transposase [Candidatus Promineifilaceae bacterium]
MLSDARDSASPIRLLEQMIVRFPADRWLVIEGNLSIDPSREVKVALLAWPEIQIQSLPKSACWLNLIAPWWKQLRSLALKGRRFETKADLADALCEALHSWDAHRRPYQWKKRPQEQFSHFLGGFGLCLEF